MHDTPSVLVLGDGEVFDRTLGHLRGVIDAVGQSADPLPENLRSFSAVGFAVDRPYPHLAERIDQAAWQENVPWIEASLVAHEWRVGPKIVPGHTPCYECWKRRVTSMASDPESQALIDSFARQTSGPWFRGSLDAITEQVASILAAELLGLALGNSHLPSHGLGLFWTGNAISGTMHARKYARIGGCPRCGRPDDYGHNLHLLNSFLE